MSTPHPTPIRRCGSLPDKYVTTNATSSAPAAPRNTSASNATFRVRPEAAPAATGPSTPEQGGLWGCCTPEPDSGATRWDRPVRLVHMSQVAGVRSLAWSWRRTRPKVAA
ncbi:hypothetical protein ACIP93_06465 [Streptomyces sp. NPDC088745]|uniref:hypothetical protein n=1 Tax=Streptomyces sp. NPDC088745 TaxID=3365884 RepID=UPI0038210AAF